MRGPRDRTETGAGATERGFAGEASHEPRRQPYDNAKAERFMRTLKEEEVNGKTYASIDEARTDIGAFLETVYNRGRLHSALGYKPPVEFEAELRQLETV